MGKNSRLFLIYEPSEMGQTYVVGAVLATSIEKAASSIGGELEVRRKKESIVWLPERDFFEMWKGKRYRAGEIPDTIEDGFENLLWQISPTEIIHLGLISPLWKKQRLGFAIKEIPLLSSSGGVGVGDLSDKRKVVPCLDGVSNCVPTGGPECAGCDG